MNVATRLDGQATKHDGRQGNLARDGCVKREKKAIYAITSRGVVNSPLLPASVSKRVLAHNHSNGNELRILMQIKLISLTIAEHQDSLRNRDKQQLGNGPFTEGDNVRRTRHMREIRMYSKSTEKPLALGGTANLFWEEIL